MIIFNNNFNKTDPKPKFWDLQKAFNRKVFILEIFRTKAL